MMKDNTEGAERHGLCRRVTDASSLLRSEVAAAQWEKENYDLRERAPCCSFR